MNCLRCGMTVVAIVGLVGCGTQQSADELTEQEVAAVEVSAATVAHWVFDGPVGEEIGDGARKFVGAVHGVTESEEEGAWFFPGDTANIRVPHSAALDLTGGLTIEASLRLARLGNPNNGLGVQAIAEKHLGKGGYLLVVTPTGKVAYWMETPVGRSVDSSDVAIEPDSGWHHVAMTWNGRFVRFYVDGESAGEHAFAGPLGTCPQDLFLGNDDTRNWGLKGDIAEIRITDRALAPNEFLGMP